MLVQTNFGGVLEINGVPIGKELKKHYFDKEILQDVDGSCMIVVATDAPLSPRNLERVAKRAIMGLAKTGGIASNGSGDYVIAFSTAENNFIPNSQSSPLNKIDDLRNEEMSPIFMATIEATEEAIINSLFAAKTMTGRDNHRIEALPIEKVIKIMKDYNRID